MAEGLVNHYLGDDWNAYSAGTDPSGYVHPLAIGALAELGIDISNHTSKSTESFRDASLDWVVTVCDDAAENCPLWLGQGNTVHIGFPDPAQATGTDDEKMVVFRLPENMDELMLVRERTSRLGERYILGGAVGRHGHSSLLK
jgi:arsenate reductase